MHKIVEMCQDCYGTHYTEAEKLKCQQSQMQSDATPQRLFGHHAAKRYGFTCGNCGSVHFTREELQQCREIG